ncbi:hypothetical protein Rsub_05148 [Raphidocelis subcapitata]|uniref:Dual specificity phosphatase n=1 Tax=Raphidocelis subcapitata TaxID=307507 RepID=A0A2V0NY33_9CHLO|nr:hypothetical protein Rsub_05148 [Raphidocelis subcapitata]|eukprot:GBF92534.1 hypothetical protein Rsub_05148 [Raphidocelis subcapitata]
MKGKREREEACSTCGHYHDYEGGEPCKVCGHVLTTAASGRPESVMPTTVVPGFLYLGSYDTASRQELLKAMQITDILNTVPACQPLFRNTFNYHTVSVAPPDFEECFEFLDRVNSANRRVLVYCMTGISRGPAVVIGYLMKLRHWRLAEAYKWVKDKRQSVNITPGDTKRLMDLEVELHNSCSVPFGLAAVTLPGSLLSAASPPQPGQLHVGQQQQQQQQQQPGGDAASPNGIFGGHQWHSSSGAAQPPVFGAAPAPAPAPAGGHAAFGAGGQHPGGEHSSEMET